MDLNFITDKKNIHLYLYKTNQILQFHSNRTQQISEYFENETIQEFG